MSPRAHTRTTTRFVLWLVIACGAILLGIRTYYPVDAVAIIRAAAEEFELAPAFVASVIRAESRFRPSVVSSAGAIGLMQILPSTGQWIADQIGLDSFETNALYEPAVNIRFGCWYLRYLLDRFKNQTPALMAYNAGPSQVDAWDWRVDRAFPETQAYIHRIQCSHAIYRIYFKAPWLVELIPSLRF